MLTNHIEHQVDFTATKEMREISSKSLISDVIRKRRLSYIGHVLRMNEKIIPHQSLNFSPEERRKRGRHKETPRRTILRESTSMGLKNIREFKSLALNRLDWRTIISALCDAYGTEGS